MTLPIAEVNTVPYCGACGWKPISATFGVQRDLNSDAICDACGADLLAYGWAGLLPPPEESTTLAGDTPLAGDVSVTFVANPGADSTDLRWRINDGAWSVITGVTSVFVLTQIVTGATSTDKIDIQLRSVVNTVPGPWGTIESVTIA